MRKLAFLVVFLLSLVSAASARDWVCLHYTPDPLGTCQFLADKLDFVQEPFSVYEGRHHEVIWLSGFGTPDGFWTTQDRASVIPWQELVHKYHTDILVVDACYSGRVFDYPIPDEMVVISSTNSESVSINTIEPWTDGRAVSTLASMVYCLLTSDEKCADHVGCYDLHFDNIVFNKIDPQVCQMGLILEHFADYPSRRGLLLDLEQRPEWHPNISLGTAMINGEPLR